MLHYLALEGLGAVAQTLEAWDLTDGLQAVCVQAECRGAIGFLEVCILECGLHSGVDIRGSSMGFSHCV
jgi:hypothetical protein